VLLRPLRRSDVATCPNALAAGRVEWDRVKVGLGLLQMRLTSRPLLIAPRDERADGEFRQSYGGDERLGGQQGGIGQPR
jgi:hypothetical protein